MKHTILATLITISACETGQTCPTALTPRYNEQAEIQGPIALETLGRIFIKCAQVGESLPVGLALPYKAQNLPFIHMEAAGLVSKETETCIIAKMLESGADYVPAGTTGVESGDSSDATG